MTTANIAWLAGLFEGEGCINQDKRKKATWRLRVVMTDFDIIQRLHAITGVGNVSETTKQELHHKPAYQWIVYRKEHIQHLLSKMLPYLGNRRAHVALNALDTIELL